MMFFVPFLCLLQGDGGLEELLAAGDFRRAWEFSEAEADVLRRAQQRALILYRAGDPGGALSAAQVGLDESGEDLGLLHRATLAAIWIQDPGAATAYVQSLERAVRASQALSAQEKGSWLEAVEDLEARSEALKRHEEERAGAVGRARTLSIGALIAAFLFLLANLRPDGRRERAAQGRSSSPVS